MMDKEQLIEAIASSTGCKLSDVRRLTNALLGTIGDVLKSGETLTLSDFGKFRMKKIPLKRHIRHDTGEKITVPEHTKVSFTPYRNILIYSEKYRS